MLETDERREGDGQVGGVEAQIQPSREQREEDGLLRHGGVHHADDAEEEEVEGGEGDTVGGDDSDHDLRGVLRLRKMR